MKTVTVKEGACSFLIPEKTLRDPHHCEVFYNSFMQTNRTLSAAFLASALKIYDFKKPVLFDGFCGTGVRGIRYLKESGVSKVVFNDANDKAATFIKKNIAKNKVEKKSEVLIMDVNQALANSPCFDVIELDPFGTPLHAMDSAFRRGKKKFILSITFTDLANLCGGHKDVCKRYYRACSINCQFSHELALRIALARSAEIAAFHDYGVTPIVSWYEGHYVKLLLLCDKRSEKADKNFENIGVAWFCSKCLSRGVSKTRLALCDCGEKLKIASSLWIGSYLDKTIVKNSLTRLSGKAEKIALLLLNELEIPLFYSLPELTSFSKKQTPKIDVFTEKLRKSGFDASKTHFSPDAFKTNAPASELLKLI